MKLLEKLWIGMTVFWLGVVIALEYLVIDQAGWRMDPQSAWSRALALQLAGFGLSCVLGILLFKARLSRSLEHLRLATRRLTKGEYGARAASDGRNAITELSVAFNDMASAIEQRNAELHAGAERFRSTFEQAAMGFAHVSPDGRWLRVNQKLGDILGYGREELLTRSLQDIAHPDDPEADLTRMRQLLAGDIDTCQLEMRGIRKNGSPVWLNLTVSLVWRAPGIPDHFIMTVEDIQGRKHNEQEIERLNRVYAVLSSVNKLIVRTRDPQILFESACRIAVVKGGFRLAWVGRVDPDTRRVSIVAHAGDGKDMLDAIDLCLDGEHTPTCPMTGPLGQGRHFTCQEVEHATCNARWKQRAIELGYRSAIALPIQPFGRVEGIFALYAQEAGFFDDAEVALLEEMAMDMNFALEYAEQETRRTQAEESLRLAAKVFESTLEGVVITDGGGNIIAVNRAFRDITGYAESEVLGENPRLLKSGRHEEGFYQHMWSSLLSTGHWQGEIWNRRKNGELYPEWLTISDLRDENGMVANFVGVFADITRVKHSEEKLEHLVHHDALTDLPNRLLLFSYLEHAVGRARRGGSQGAVLFIDLDRFKTVNDSLGHPAGDEILRIVSRRIRERVRDADTLARLGGDEFVVVVEELPRPEAAADVAQDIIQLLDAPITLSGGQEIFLGASIGISLFPGDGLDATSLIQYADAALFQAKESGRGTYRFYTEALTRAANRRLEMEARLRRALERNEFVLHYQPQISVTDGRLIGCEALLRWQPPGDDLISPLFFIPLAEDTGLIRPLGEWVLRTACAQMRKWQDSGMPPITLAVNVSSRQFEQYDLAERVADILAETGLPAGFLELEITESTIMHQGEQASAMLDALKRLGLSLSIDDFGTGYSSLAYLKRFAVDKLKIDKSFVRDIGHDTNDAQIAATIIAMAKNLKLEVLAEGVETRDQLAFLELHGCDAFQGYLHSPAVPAVEFARLAAL